MSRRSSEVWRLYGDPASLVRDSILESVSVRVYFKGAQTLKGQLVKPKDKDPLEKVQDVVYFIKDITIRDSRVLYSPSTTLNTRKLEIL